MGKSSFLNMVAGQDVAITSPVAGTTTDIVEKSMELLPIGPVVLLDTAGMDDTSELSGQRTNRARKIFSRADVICIVVEPGIWNEYEDNIISEAAANGVPVIAVVNKIDAMEVTGPFLEAVRRKTRHVVLVSSTDQSGRDRYVDALKKSLIDVCPEGILSSAPLISDLVPSGGLAVLVVPIDLEAPKGRLILPQVQTIRDALDNDSMVLVVKEREYRMVYETLKREPDLVVCDSQVVLKVVADTPRNVKCTTFSILMARHRSDLNEMVRGAAEIAKLRPGDRVLIAEACSHHALEDDIGRVKIPRWLRQHTGGDIKVDVCSGRDYPDDLSSYRLVVHCGGCMLTRREMLHRVRMAKEAGVSVTNYGVCIACTQGVLGRVLEAFPAALDIYNRNGHDAKGVLNEQETR